MDFRPEHSSTVQLQSHVRNPEKKSKIKNANTKNLSNGFPKMTAILCGKITHLTCFVSFLFSNQWKTHSFFIYWPLIILKPSKNQLWCQYGHSIRVKMQEIHSNDKPNTLVTMAIDTVSLTVCSSFVLIICSDLTIATLSLWAVLTEALITLY